MDTLKQQLHDEIKTKIYKSKPMVIIKNEYLDDFYTLAGNRGWLKQEYIDYVCKCNHQAHKGFMDKEHTHLIIDVGFI